MNSITFRLTTGKTEGTWDLKGGSAKRNGISKFINYREGANSIWEEDNEKNATPPKRVVFRYNDLISDPACEIVVPLENKILIDYLKAHPYFNIHYKIHNVDEIAEEQLENFDKIEAALAYIRESDDTKVQAMALAILGISAFGLTVPVCKTTLKEKALKFPDTIIKAVEADNYESKYLSALAFYTGIVSENSMRNAVIWQGDESGTILHLAKGENGMIKLGEMLGTNTDESRLVHQEIALRLDQRTAMSEAVINTVVVLEDTPETKKALADKDEYIKTLEAKLAKTGEATGGPASDTDPKSEAPSVGDPALENKGTEDKVYTLVEATAAYVEKHKTAVPNPMKNNLDWIVKKMKE